MRFSLSPCPCRMTVEFRRLWNSSISRVDPFPLLLAVPSRPRLARHPERLAPHVLTPVDTQEPPRRPLCKRRPEIFLNQQVGPSDPSRDRSTGTLDYPSRL